MSTPYTRTRLTEVRDSAPDFGFGEFQEARFAGEHVDARDTGFALLRVRPNQRQPFAHRHETAEEVYVVLSGSGRMKLDDDVIAVERLDAIRVAPPVTRAFEGGPDGLEILAFGPRCAGDGEVFPGWWTD